MTEDIDLPERIFGPDIVTISKHSFYQTAHYMPSTTAASYRTAI